MSILQIGPLNPRVCNLFCWIWIYNASCCCFFLSTCRSNIEWGARPSLGIPRQILYTSPQYYKTNCKTVCKRINRKKHEHRQVKEKSVFSFERGLGGGRCHGACSRRFRQGEEIHLRDAGYLRWQLLSKGGRHGARIRSSRMPASSRRSSRTWASPSWRTLWMPLGRMFKAGQRAWRGEAYNGCIMAYGQTGSGKSHSVLGYLRPLT